MACNGVHPYLPSPLTTNKSAFDALCGKRDEGWTHKENLENHFSLSWLLGLFTLIWVHPSPPYQELKEHQDLRPMSLPLSSDFLLISEMPQSPILIVKTNTLIKHPEAR